MISFCMKFSKRDANEWMDAYEYAKSFLTFVLFTLDSFIYIFCIYILSGFALLLVNI